ncbi:Uncharacterised protein [Legionella pneumophila]|nr:hypothetical protein lptwr_02474 [Legionella pneumophila]CZI47467.1 Uncharacterised protein [Legionella pneumophila]CZJ63926.1 Uncharacterised protein [Legionella pneumophila]CZR08281.1 Uncharacterised protein [Legionella pneumophila]STX66384.1 Uncharacterised protein [Legionella pneumophila]
MIKLCDEMYIRKIFPIFQLHTVLSLLACRKELKFTLLYNGVF